MKIIIFITSELSDYPILSKEKNFTATESERIILIIGESRRAGVGYGLDNFRLSKNWKTTIHCDRSNLQYADGAGRYRIATQIADGILDLRGLFYTIENTPDLIDKSFAITNITIEAIDKISERKDDTK